RLQDPAADLAVAGALVSALAEKPIASDTILMGEIALSGEIRPVAHSGLRLREAAKLGFARAWTPTSVSDGPDALRLQGYATLGALVDQMLGRN
ncbi:MAG: magnesium chelatase domain-containing protein, partial [Sphingobium sp.]